MIATYHNKQNEKKGNTNLLFLLEIYSPTYVVSIPHIYLIILQCILVSFKIQKKKINEFNKNQTESKRKKNQFKRKLSERQNRSFTFTFILAKRKLSLKMIK